MDRCGWFSERLTDDEIFAFVLLIAPAVHMTATGLSCATELPLNPKFCNK